ncbi:type II toxin-antitoxin system HicA family toxin [Fructobacillus parabroussonetiae]|uniref:Addiction module toxin, HicA family n=1 Tax=Fructobacillus parabroussonetiae TaxID=2713174 RepID=A0ABS5QXL8_9LACO|nr:type II toxin-antitoxin system HicA family toxin [Fructobacillus parabroussonetiae]MBS9337948.1 addiction module toxin, HicA family [Fructobacillus parabroussonetiae]MCK8617852.1 type II toxin-antitoxin system HicA family toxin [Fructobacillus parabroussonetiae]
MTIKPEKLEKIVLQQGFKRVKTKGRGSHRRYQHADGRTTEIPFHGHGAEISKGTERAVMKDIGLV